MFTRKQAKSLLSATFFGLLAGAGSASSAHTNLPDSVKLACEIDLISNNNHIVRMQDDLAVKVGGERFLFHQHPISDKIPTTILPQEFPQLVSVLKKLNQDRRLLKGEPELKVLALKNFLSGFHFFDANNDDHVFDVKQDEHLAILEDLLYEAVQDLDLGDLKSGQPTKAGQAVVDVIRALTVQGDVKGRAFKSFGTNISFHLMVALVAGMSDASLDSEGFVDAIIKPLRASRKAARGNWGTFEIPRFNQKVQFRLIQRDYEKFRFYTNS